MNFQFPPNIQKYERFQSFRDLKNTFNEDLKEYRGFFYKFTKNKFKNNKTRYLLQCNKCHAKLWYHMIENELVLSSYSTKHIHQVQKVGKDINPFVVKQIARLNRLYQDEEMERSYEQNSKCLYLTLCFLGNLKMLVFSGLDNSRTINVFALCLMDVITKGRVKNLLHLFFERKNVPPKTIITNVEQYIPIIKEEYCGVIILNPGEVKENQPKKLQLERLILCTTRSEFDQLKRKALMATKENVDLEEVRKFFQVYDYLAIAMLPPTFVGIGIHPFHKTSLEQVLEETVLKEGVKDLSRLIRNFSKKIETRHPNKSIMGILKDQATHNSFLQLLQQLSEYAVSFMILEYNKSLPLSLEACQTENAFLVFSVNNEYLNAKIYNQEKRLHCTCQLRIKTGLLCCHLIKYGIHFLIDLKELIDPFWLVKGQKKYEEKIEDEKEEDEDQMREDNGYLNKLRSRKKK